LWKKALSRAMVYLKTFIERILMKNKIRQRELIFQSSPCDVNFHSDGPRTLAEAKTAGRSVCPHYAECQYGLNTKTGYGCVMHFAVEVSQNVLKQGNTVHNEVYGDLAEAIIENKFPPKGLVYSPDRKVFGLITDGDTALRKIAEFASQVVGVPSTGKPPQAVGPNFEHLMAAITDSNGTVDLHMLDQLEGRFAGLPGRNRRCDVLKGPCACGAWH
jgi:hypothetical protein